jgi:hypothetical protein
MATSMPKPTRMWFSIGRRCVTDDFLNLAGLRSCSGPFSYCLCDIETATHNIVTGFQHYLDSVVTIGPYEGPYLPCWRMTRRIHVNQHYSDPLSDRPVYDMQRLLIWNHHDLASATVCETLRRRAVRLMSLVNSSNTKVMLLHISRQTTMSKIVCLIKKVEILASSIRSEGPNTKIVLVVPCEDIRNISKVASSSELVDVWTIPCVPMSSLLKQKSSETRERLKLDADSTDPRIPWKELARIFKSHYSI